MADSSNIPNWTFKIEGRLLPSKKQPDYKFSRFVKAITVEIERDNELYPNSNLIHWVKPPNCPEMDGFEVKRRGDAQVNLKILLYLDEQPERHKLSPGLQKLLGIHSECLSNVIVALWQYIKSHRLLDSEDRRVVICDEKLAAVILYLIRFSTLRNLISQMSLKCFHSTCFPAIQYTLVIQSGTPL